MSKTYEFNMDMTCEGCANAAKKVLGKLGVTDVVTDVGTKIVTVKSDLGSDELLEALKKTGKTISLKSES